MPRNENLPLTDEQSATVARFSEDIFDFIGAEVPVTLHYVKRDGSASQSTGVMLHTLGQDSTLSVRILTEDKGERTVNLAGLTAVKVSP